MSGTEKSEKIKNYAIAGFFITGTLFALLLGMKLLTLSQADEPNIWSQCAGNEANVYISAIGGNTKNIRCIALDNDAFLEKEITIGDLSKNDEDVCRFKLTGNATGPLKFEIRYGDKTRKEVCNWQSAQGID